jgi:hypothetical protein
MSMILHCGAKAITRTELGLLPTPEPMGPRHVVRPFIDDVEMVSDEMKAIGLSITREAFGVTKDAEGMPTRFFGLMELDGAGDDGFSLMVGLRGSYDQRLPRGLAVGSRVFVCDNLAFGGQIEMHTKQTTNISKRIPVLIRDAVAQIPGAAEEQNARFGAYRAHQVAKRVGDAMLIEMVRRGILMPSHLGRALAEWDKPCHDEHAEDGYSLWRLHNAVTEALKPANPERGNVPAVWERTLKMTGMLDDIRVGGFPIYH